MAKSVSSSVPFKEEEDDEQAVLASLDAALHDQDVYEDRVIRDATHRLAPRLSGLGFPALHDLAPGVSIASSNADHYNPSDLPHVHAVLGKTRQALLDGHTHRTAHERHVLLLQEQMLLAFLQNVARVSPEELPTHRLSSVRTAAPQTPTDERRRETAAMDAAVPMSISPTAKRPRIPMMQRKRREQGLLDEEEFVQRREHLKKMRLERKRRKEHRRKLLLREDDVSGDQETDTEMEFDNDDNAAATSTSQIKVNNPTADDSNLVVEKQNGQDSAPALTCPLCGDALLVDDPSKLDSTLSRHMDQCQHRRRSRRSTRSQSTAVDTVEIGADDRPVPRTLPPRAAMVRSKGARKGDTPVFRMAPSIDDLEEASYEDRVDDWIENGLTRMKEMKERDSAAVLPGDEELHGGLHIPAWLNDRLFEYQRIGLKWMWKLHQEEAGGIIGDEMGLGKTVQASSFIGVLAASRKLKSVLIISPATMLQHWLNELAVWAPGLRRILIHQSGEGDGSSRNITASLLKSLAKWLKGVRADRLYEPIDVEDLETLPSHSFCGTGYVVLTTYENVRRNTDIYTEHAWSYVVLDEAQKIRNPDADITLACKRIRTPHRLAMSGTPIQNDLKELWSLFDFVFPGRLGTLPAFEQEFADTIKRGGYSNASPMQVQLAYRCAMVLRDLINPYLLRRQKKDVIEVSRMPGKTEHVLFCRLSQRQRALYEAFLLSDEVTKVVKGSKQLFAAVTMLRKICNHPDLACDPDEASFESFVRNGYVNQGDLDEDLSDLDSDIGEEKSLVERSGKLEVLSKILPLWKKQGHRVLIFCQWRKMLDIIERLIMLKEWKFGRLDGNTNVASRQRLVDQFNSDESYFGMLCTTRTGGVGLNLTGANRIILYDPDWNPQTDAQARERAWRFGQEREVTVYRLITAGTIEEKIYQRQIFKTALSNKVLQDPRQRRLFSQKDLRDLFTLKADAGSVRSGGEGLTETGAITRHGGVVNIDEDPTDEPSLDNDEALKTVMRSRGLAGVFDHNFVEIDSTKKSRTLREMEEEAKRVAKEAIDALQQSVAIKQRFVPTWTGSEETQQRRFGTPKMHMVDSKDSLSSRTLLASIRQRDNAVHSGGNHLPPSDESQEYAKLLAKIKDYVYRYRPTTDDLLKEFESVSNTDVAIFRRLLKSVANVDSGRWLLK